MHFYPPSHLLNLSLTPTERRYHVTWPELFMKFLSQKPDRFSSCLTKFHHDAPVSVVSGVTVSNASVPIEPVSSKPLSTKHESRSRSGSARRSKSRSHQRSRSRPVDRRSRDRRYRSPSSRISRSLSCSFSHRRHAKKSKKSKSKNSSSISSDSSSSSQQFYITAVTAQVVAGAGLTII